MTSAQIETFASEARKFCQWALGVDNSPMTASSALARISHIYVAGLELPGPWTDGLSTEDAGAETPSGTIELVIKRASQLPFQFYWKIFEPLEDPPREPVGGHLTDDIGDIYQDISRGLVLYDANRKDEARWEWGFNFRNHWGEHATGAIRALHAYLSQEDPDGLSSDA
jgi:hypothetical protein